MNHMNTRILEFLPLVLLELSSVSSLQLILLELSSVPSLPLPSASWQYHCRDNFSETVIAKVSAMQRGLFEAEQIIIVDSVYQCFVSDLD